MYVSAVLFCVLAEIYSKVLYSYVIFFSFSVAGALFWLGL